MSVSINGEEFTTLADYMNDEIKVSKAEKAQIEAEVALITKECERNKKMKKRNIYQAAMEYISGNDLFYSVWEPIRKCSKKEFPQRVRAFDKVCYDFQDVTFKTKRDRDYIVSLMIAATLYGVFRKDYDDFRSYAIDLDAAQTKFETFKC